MADRRSAGPMARPTRRSICAPGPRGACATAGAAGTIGPMGSEVFEAPPRAGLFRLTLPSPAAATLAVDNQAATIAQPRRRRSSSADNTRSHRRRPPQYRQPAVPHIYAAGDVIGAPQLASTSAEQGRLAACHALQRRPPAAVPELFPYGIYAIPEIGWVGQDRGRAHPQPAYRSRLAVARYKEIARGQILGDDNGLLKLIFHLDTQKILGVWVLGSQATEVVHIGQAVMSLGGTLDYFL